MRIALLVYCLMEVGLALVIGTELYMTGGSGEVFELNSPFYELYVYGALGSGIGYTIAFIASVVFVCLWTYRAMKNLHLIGSEDAEMSPGWAVGWYFIPFASLWMPLKGMNQIWRGSHREAKLPHDLPAQIAIWWVIWVVTNIAANISIRLGGWDGSGEEYQASLYIDLATTLPSIVCALLLIWICKRVTEVQAQWVARQFD